MSADAGDRRDRLELVGAIDRLDLPVALIDLGDLTVRAASQELANLSATGGAVVGQPIMDLLPLEDRPAATVALHAMQTGSLDFFRAKRAGRTVDGAPSLATFWVRAVCFGDVRLALVEATTGQTSTVSPLERFVGREPMEMAIGIANADCVIESVSCETKSLIGTSPREIVGQRLLTAARQRQLRAMVVDHGTNGYSQTFALRTFLRDGAGARRPLCVLLTSVTGAADHLFILLPDSESAAIATADRAAELERHLWRIAAEVDASGVLQRIGRTPDARRFPQLQDLSVRQWEVLSRLLHGERVPTIASELFVSQSTVRNHLSGIFERFGVHSQPELLKMLAPLGDVSA